MEPSLALAPIFSLPAEDRYLASNMMTALRTKVLKSSHQCRMSQVLCTWSPLPPTIVLRCPSLLGLFLASTNNGMNKLLAVLAELPTRQIRARVHPVG